MTDDTQTVEKAHIEAIPEEPQLPGHETQLEPKPDWEPRYPGSGRLKGKVAIVTGGDSGIGRAIAVLFAREGANVAIAYLDEDDDARITADAIEQEGGEALLFAGDLGDPELAKDLVEQTIEEVGPARRAGQQRGRAASGQGHPRHHARAAAAHVPDQHLLDVLSGPGRAAAPQEGRGDHQLHQRDDVPGHRRSCSTTRATKGAITAFTRSLSENLIGDGIRVNAVAPGPIWTPLNPFGGSSPEKLESFGENTPMGRPGQPNEVAPAFLFLACEDSTYMSGQVLHPNGGTIPSTDRARF